MPEMSLEEEQPASLLIRWLCGTGPWQGGAGKVAATSVSRFILSAVFLAGSPCPDSFPLYRDPLLLSFRGLHIHSRLPVLASGRSGPPPSVPPLVWGFKEGSEANLILTAAQSKVAKLCCRGI